MRLWLSVIADTYAHWQEGAMARLVRFTTKWGMAADVFRFFRPIS